MDLRKHIILIARLLWAFTAAEHNSLFLCRFFFLSIGEMIILIINWVSLGCDPVMRLI